MNLRADSTFVEGKGWHAAASRYDDFFTPAQKPKIPLEIQNKSIGISKDAGEVIENLLTGV